MWGASWEKPVRQMREYLDGLQPLLAGERADAVGEFWTTRAALALRHRRCTLPRWGLRCCDSQVAAARER